MSSSSGSHPVLSNSPVDCMTIINGPAYRLRWALTPETFTRPRPSTASVSSSAPSPRASTSSFVRHARRGNEGCSSVEGKDEEEGGPRRREDDAGEGGEVAGLAAGEAEHGRR